MLLRLHSLSRAPLGRLSCGRFLNHHQFVESLKTNFLYTSGMRALKREGVQFLYVFCGSKATKLPTTPLTRILDFDPTPLL